MTPVEPTLHEGAHLMTFAKDQPTYKPLLASVDAEGTVMTEWEPTSDELERLRCGGRIRLWVHTFDANVGKPGHELQPVSVEVVEPDCGMRES